MVYAIISLTAALAAVIILSLISRKKRNEKLKEASESLRDFIKGGEFKRIDCDEEGELNILLHEVNSLVSILNAHIDKEERNKDFLKNSISDISHQLKTPIAALNIYNGILLDECENPESVKEFTKLSEQELERIENLVQNLLKITKIDSGTMEMNKKQENLSNIMDYIESHFKARAKKEGKELVFKGDNNISLYCDRTWITEAISNIVKNGLDHMSEGDSVKVTWMQQGDILRISIKDSGSGIHSEDINHIFKRFYRSRFTQDTKGLGLGLPLSKSLIEMHSGTIEVESELNKGTEFTINFLNPTKL